MKLQIRRGFMILAAMTMIGTLASSSLSTTFAEPQVVLLGPTATATRRTVAMPTRAATRASLPGKAAQPLAAENLVSDGDFEDPAIPGPWNVVYYAPAIFGSWTIESGSIDHIGPGYWQAASGYQSVDLNGYSAATIYQDIPTTPGESYSLSFAMAGNPHGGPWVVTMEVWWEASLIDTLTFDTTGHSINDMGWTRYQYAVVASDDSTRLRFKSITGTCCNGPTLDNVTVVVGATTYSISGRVTDSALNPIGGVTISDNVGHNTTTDGIGGYSLSGLSVGTYVITPTKSGYSFSPSLRLVNVLGNKTYQDFVTVGQPLSQSCEVPFFSQRNPAWITHTLGTDVNSPNPCSLACNTIGACGCTLTSGAMVFSYFGAKLNPPALSDAMGVKACPFDHSIGASKTGGKAVWVSLSGFTWSRLDQELNYYHRPVILGMCRKGTCGTDHEDTHWIVVLSGQGGNPSNYKIHDPWQLDGHDLILDSEVPAYDFRWLSVYSGQPSCSQATSSTARQARLIPSSVRQTSSIVTGETWILRMTPVTMTVQLIAESSAGNVTDMLLWTDTVPNSTWQPFTTVVSLPRSDIVYAKFRDEFGNLSDQYMDSLYPINSPRNPLITMFLPTIRK